MKKKFRQRHKITFYDFISGYAISINQILDNQKHDKNLTFWSVDMVFPEPTIHYSFVFILMEKLSLLEPKNY